LTAVQIFRYGSFVRSSAEIEHSDITEMETNNKATFSTFPYSLQLRHSSAQYLSKCFDFVQCFDYQGLGDAMRSNQATKTYDIESKTWNDTIKI